MFQNATVSSRSSSSRSGHSCSRNSSMPSLRMRSPLSPKTSYNPLYRHSDALTSFDASHFIFRDQKRQQHKNVILRRYNSHDSHTTNTQIDDMCKDNTPDSTKSRTSASTSSTTPGTSPDSTGLRLSSATNTTSSSGSELEARDFLERYSLPRVVRVADGSPLLLYRCFDSFTKVQAHGLHIKKNGKEKLDEVNVLQFPEGYPGWFSLLNDKGEKCAVTHTSVLQLVREQVCSFISLQPFTAYAGHNLDPNETQSKVQYVKTQVKPGQLFQLRAVFQHRDMESSSGGHQNHSKASVTSRMGRSTKDKDLGNRYAQLISQTNQEFYVPLTTKGEFYEIHSSIKAKLCFPGLLDKTGPLALDRDCLYKLTHLLRRIALPIRVKLMSGPLPLGAPKDFPDTFILERKFQEPLMVTCTLPAPSEKTPHQISCIHINSTVRISRCMLGFDSENRLFKSQRLQSALAFCHKNVESWYREVRLSPNLNNKPNYTSCFDCRKLNRLCSETCSHRAIQESEEKQIINREMAEKFSKPKKWYKHFMILGASAETNGKDRDKDGHVENVDKVKSIDRYKDMSKLIEEKFGKKSHNPVKKSASFMFATKRIDLHETPTQTKNNPSLVKCQSLDTQLYSIDENQSVRKHAPWRNSKSNVSESFSSDFQNCILHNENTILPDNEATDKSTKNLQTTDLDLDEIRPVEDITKALRKLKPDLIPTLSKDDHSYITDRLCSEFHVKTKVQQKRSISKHSLLAANFEKSRSSLRVPDTINASLSIFDVESEEQIIDGNTKSVVVQVHEDTVLKAKSKLKKRLLEEDIPYSNVADEVRLKPNGRKAATLDENIYSEICDERCPHAGCTCTKKATIKMKTGSEYCYVKLGSNGDSVTQSDSDEAIYNTLR